jgi:predicted dienelactone hydrolase
LWQEASLRLKTWFACPLLLGFLACPARGAGIVDPEGVARVLNALPGQPEVHVVPAGHFAFLPPCSPELAANLPRFCTDPAGFDRAAFHRHFDTGVVRFFREHL